MSDIEEVSEDISFLEGEITGLRKRIGDRCNEYQAKKLTILQRILERNRKWLTILHKRAA